MAIKKLPKRTEENTVVRKSFQERAAESRLIRIQQKTLAELNDSTNKEDDDIAEQTSGGVSSDSEEMKGVREMKSDMNFSEKDVIRVVDDVEVIEVVEADLTEKESGVQEVIKEDDEMIKNEMAKEETVAEDYDAEDIAQSIDPPQNSDEFKTSEEETSGTATKLIFELADSRGSTRTSYSNIVMSLVNSPKSSMRMTLDKDMISKVGSPSSIQVGFTTEGILIGKLLSSNKKEDGYFILKPSGGKYVVYSSPLVREITEKFSLDFSQRVSRSFDKVDYVKVGKYTVAHIKVA
ncbi:hypothetical protein ACHAL6_00095 [Proteiniclasticum sp. C24MP]|uniref:hypothetical protein n=1 Tax=Proteiniclasticum sp. C24MP TaxID=3374101 RepID=UPI003754646A